MPRIYPALAAEGVQDALAALDATAVYGKPFLGHLRLLAQTGVAADENIRRQLMKPWHLELFRGNGADLVSVDEFIVGKIPAGVHFLSLSDVRFVCSPYSLKHLRKLTMLRCLDLSRTAIAVDA
jgi:hypothetical protein